MRNVRIPVIILTSFAILVGVWPAPKAAAPIKALRFGKLIDGAGKAITNAVVVIENDRIRSVSADWVKMYGSNGGHGDHSPAAIFASAGPNRQ
ncbi:MAG: hypothetical protein MOB07_08200 [Acidobacteria bacterium]|nr:hypothetical protein [Acidobacteriota bacterium]